MSYILDALRKADAQRQRTRLPGLQAQPTPAPAEGTAPVWRSPIAWLLAAGLLVAMLVLAWPSSQTTTSVAPAAIAVAPAPSAPPPAVVTEPPLPTQSQAPVVATAIQPAPPPPRPAAEVPQRPPVRSTTDKREPAPVRATSASAAASAAVANPAAGSSAAGKAAPAESSTPPPGAPKLAITGGVYSADAAQRLLIVGGQVFNEGSEVAPGVVLEQVRRGQALLSYQGQRFTVRY